ncbi:DNA-protecting protein DprA [Candidatus Uhrbacteria bacterium]|nr:DNA-protecting protein DprA [Candidatus Uhrbacteria bacterium]
MSSQLSNEELKYWVSFTPLTKFGPLHWQKVLKAFPSPKEAWGATRAELERTGIQGAVLEEMLTERQNIRGEEILAACDRENIHVLTLRDPEYPELLKTLYNPPALLFYKGTLGLPDVPCIGVVGTRMITTYGRQITPMLVQPLARGGITIVSGLAMGIDTVAHETTLAAGGRTIAVLGSGLDAAHVYPAQNRNLVQNIVDHGGCVLGEYPPGTQPLRHHFPYRNRIIAGMSRGVLVIEAAEESGALITARIALEENREVFAVPGPITSPQSAGTNLLLKQGAHPVNEAQDMLDILNWNDVPRILENRVLLPESPEEEKMLPCLSQEPTHIDELVTRSGLATPAAMTTLTMMEMKGKVRHVGGMLYVIGS